MRSIPEGAVVIQSVGQSVPSIPSWFGEVALMARYVKRLGVLSAREAHVRFARRRFGHDDLVDFVAVLLGDAVSSEPPLKAFYERLLPFATPFMALFERDRLPARSTLSRFLASLDQTAVEALRPLFQEDLRARPLTEEHPAGLWDRQENQWCVFDVDGTKPRRPPTGPSADIGPRRARNDVDVASASLAIAGGSSGEMVRTPTTVLRAQTHQWLGTFGNPGNGDDRGELRRAVEMIQSYLDAASASHERKLCSALPGQDGNAAVVGDRADLPSVMRGRDSQVLDRAEVQARLQLPPDQQTVHPESGAVRLLYDCPDLGITPSGLRGRVVIASLPDTFWLEKEKQGNRKQTRSSHPRERT